MIRRLVLAMAFTVVAGPAAAQTANVPPTGPAIEFLPRFAFHLAGEHLSSDDERFIWDANVGGEIDLIDYGAGRATFTGNYQVILGDEFRNFDANQGNYILAGSLSGRVPGLEVAAVFHHESRHLSDRIKRFPVDWNMLGVRARSDLSLGAVRLDARADVRGVIQKSFVDYRWEFDGSLGAGIPLRPGIGLVAGLGMRIVGVDGSRDRGRQTGFRAEGGVRLEGRGAAVELFLAAERRIDPYPLDFTTARWVTAGFRLLSR